MNERKLNQLFAAARSETAPVPADDFAASVLRGVRREPQPARETFFEQLNSLFPRLALAAATVIVLCVVTDFALTEAGLPEIGSGVSQTAAQFLFDAEDL